MGQRFRPAPSDRPLPRSVSRLLGRAGDEPGEVASDQTTAIPRGQAQDTSRTDDTAVMAEETDMQHARAPMGWTPNDYPAPADRHPSAPYARPYPDGMPAQRAPEPQGSWMYPGHASGGYAPHPQGSAYPNAPGYPQAQSPLQPYPPMQPQAYGQPTAPMPQPALAYGPYPGQHQGWAAQAPGHPYAPHPRDHRGPPPHGHDDRSNPYWGPPSHPGMPQPAYAQPYPQSMAPGWPQPGWQQPAQPQPQQTRAAPQAAPAGDGEKTAMEEIRDSLREFREALRDLAESRGRRRFL
jgi:polysaccharide biosynthesis transport protein